MKNLGLAIALSIALFQVSFAQRDMKLPKTREVIVNMGDSLIKANILYGQQKKVRTNETSIYYWFKGNKIKSNVGNYYGKLLYGRYIVFDAHDNMVVNGKLKKGMKQGKWVSWHENGNIKTIYRWKKGLRHGKYSIYESDGTLKEKGKYRRGKMKKNKKEYNNEEDYNKVKYLELKEVPNPKNNELKEPKNGWTWLKKKQEKDEKKAKRNKAKKSKKVRPKKVKSEKKGKWKFPKLFNKKEAQK